MENVLVVVDVQNDFLTGPLGTERARYVLPSIAKKVREYSGPIALTKDSHFATYLDTQEGRKLPVPHCLYGTKGWEFPKDINDAIKDAYIHVYEKSTFGCKELAYNLRNQFSQNEIASVELIGFCTDICVISNALLIKTLVPEMPVMVDEHCCAGTTPEKHEGALAAMESCQIEVKR